MSQILRQSTQVVVRIGPFMDATDAVTPETGITLGAADQAEALKAAGAATVDISGNTWAAITNAGGWYDLTLTTTDTNTIGTLEIVVQDASVCLPVFARFQVIEEAAYDAMYAAASDPKADINVASIDANVITATSIAADAITAAKIADGAIDAATFAAGAITATVIATGAIDADALATDAVAEIADGVWDEDATGHQTQGTFGQAIGDPVADANTIYKAVVTDAAGATVGIDVVAVQADTDNIQTRLPAALVGGRIDADMGGISTDSAAADALESILDGGGGTITAAIVGNITGNLSGSVGSVTGNVGGNVVGSVASVVGNVGGNVVGTVASVVGNVGGNVVGTIGGLTAGALADFFTTDSGETYASAIDGSVVKEIADNATVVGTVNANVIQISGDSAAADALESILDGGGGTLTASLVGNITGNLSGSVGSVTGNVGGNVVGSVASVVGNVGGNVVGSVASVTAPVTVGTNNDKTGYALSAGGVDAIWDDAVDGAVTARESLRLANSANGGKLSGAATTNVLIRDLADTKNRVDATVDASGNRTAITRDLT